MDVVRNQYAAAQSGRDSASRVSHSTFGHFLLVSQSPLPWPPELPTVDFLLCFPKIKRALPEGHFLRRFGSLESFIFMSFSYELRKTGIPK